MRAKGGSLVIVQIESITVDFSSEQNPDLQLARQIVQRILGQNRARVTLFGSRARGDFRRWSDIDLAVELPEASAPDLLSALREAFENSNLLLNVDVVDMRTASPELRKAIESEGTPWTD